MSDGFVDFSFGAGDDALKGGGYTKRFKAETGRTYRVSFAWFTDYDGDGLPVEDSKPKFTGCERTRYKEGVGFVLLTDSNRAAMLDLLKVEPQQRLGTVIVVWPCDKDGELDVASFKAGKGYKVQPWDMPPTKYSDIGRINKRFDLSSHDLAMTCEDKTYQKMSFAPEKDNLLQKLLSSDKEEFQAIGKRILSEARKVGENIHRDLARTMTVDEVKEKLGMDVASPTGSSHAAKDVDDLLNDVL